VLVVSYDVLKMCNTLVLTHSAMRTAVSCRKRARSITWNTTKEFEASLPGRGVQPYPLLDRCVLVARTIQLAELYEQHVYIRSAGGTGKSKLLVLIAQELERRGKLVMIVPHISYLEDCWEDIMTTSGKGPLYVLIDEAHHVPNHRVWIYLKHVPGPQFITIAAGIPDTDTSSLFMHHIENCEMMLTVGELHAPQVVEFYAHRLKQACERSEAPLQRSAACYEHAARSALQFTHMITSGHTFPCVKVMDYLVTEACEFCLASDVSTSLQRALATKHFADSALTTIDGRCFRGITADMIAHMTMVLQDRTASDLVFGDLDRLGLLRLRGGCHLSLLLQQALLYRSAHTSPRVQLNITCDTFGDVLAHALQGLPADAKEFEWLYMSLRWEWCMDGVNLYIGAALSRLHGLYVSPQIALCHPTGGREARPLSVGYYLSQPLNMYLEIVYCGNLLLEVLARYQPGGTHHGQQFAVLDIRHSVLPCPLPEALSGFEQYRYSYVVKQNALYRGVEVCHPSVRPTEA
jgi:hypothetical protein